MVGGGEGLEGLSEVLSHEGVGQLVERSEEFFVVLPDVPKSLGLPPVATVGVADLLEDAGVFGNETLGRKRRERACFLEVVEASSFFGIGRASFVDPGNGGSGRRRDCVS